MIFFSKKVPEIFGIENENCREIVLLEDFQFSKTHASIFSFNDRHFILKKKYIFHLKKCEHLWNWSYIPRFVKK